MVVLVVEDDLPSLKMLSDYLEADGHTVLVAEDGAAGIDRTIRARPDVVLLDIILPDISGYNVCATLRATPETSTIPIIYTSAIDCVLDEGIGFLEGANGYIPKPLILDVVSAAIHSATTRSSDAKLAAVKTILAQQLPDKVKLLMIQAIC